MYGVLKFVVCDKIGRGDDATDKISGVRIIVPSNPPRLQPPSFEGQSLRTGLFVRVSFFRRRMSVFGSRNNNPDTDIDSISHLMQQQNLAVRTGNLGRFRELSSILDRKMENPKQIKYRVEKFVELKVFAIKEPNGSLVWRWCTSYQLSDLTEDPKSSNTLYPAPKDVKDLDEVSDYKIGFSEIKDIPESEHFEMFSAQFKPSEKAKRQERGAAIGGLWKLITVDTVNDLEKDPRDITVVFANKRFPEPEFFGKLIGNHPELAYEQLDQLYSEFLENEHQEDGVFESGRIFGAAQNVANGHEIFINCNCGRSEKSCHCVWLKNKIGELARRIKSKQLSEKGI